MKKVVLILNLLIKSVIINLLFGILIISSCSSPSDRDLLIIDYEQTFSKGVKTDLNMRILYSEDIGFITGQDSLDYFHQKELERYSGWKDLSLAIDSRREATFTPSPYTSSSSTVTSPR